VSKHDKTLQNIAEATHYSKLNTKGSVDSKSVMRVQFTKQAESQD